jgi:CRISPR-associated endonuclease Csn1
MNEISFWRNMMKEKKNYTIGLDIGTNSVGWAVIDDDFNLVQGKKKITEIAADGTVKKRNSRTNLWGARLFDAGETAADRRLKRGARRRIARRKKRLEYLRLIFQDKVYEVDPNFFLRLDESFLQGGDRSTEVAAQFPLFPTVNLEKKYHASFPTVYHLRKTLAESNEIYDIRYIFLALNHIFKNRGHFVNQDAGDEAYGDFSKIEIKPEFEYFINKYNETFDDAEINLEDYSSEVERLLNSGKDDDAKTLGDIFENSRTGTFYQFMKLIFDLKANFKSTFGLDEEAKLQFSDEKFDEELEKLLGVIGDKFIDLFEAARNVNNALLLSRILDIKNDAYKNSPTKLSASMVERYENHAKDLKQLKLLLKDNSSKEYDDFSTQSKLLKKMVKK